MRLPLSPKSFLAFATALTVFFGSLGLLHTGTLQRFLGAELLQSSGTVTEASCTALATQLKTATATLKSAKEDADKQKTGMALTLAKAKKAYDEVAARAQQSDDPDALFGELMRAKTNYDKVTAAALTQVQQLTQNTLTAAKAQDALLTKTKDCQTQLASQKGSITKKTAATKTPPAPAKKPVATSGTTPAPSASVGAVANPSAAAQGIVGDTSRLVANAPTGVANAGSDAAGILAGAQQAGQKALSETQSALKIAASKELSALGGKALTAAKEKAVGLLGENGAAQVAGLEGAVKGGLAVAGSAKNLQASLASGNLSQLGAGLTTAANGIQGALPESAQNLISEFGPAGAELSQIVQDAQAMKDKVMADACAAVGPAREAVSGALAEVQGQLGPLLEQASALQDEAMKAIGGVAAAAASAASSVTGALGGAGAAVGGSIGAQMGPEAAKITEGLTTSLTSAATSAATSAIQGFSPEALQSQIGDLMNSKLDPAQLASAMGAIEQMQLANLPCMGDVASGGVTSAVMSSIEPKDVKGGGQSKQCTAATGAGSVGDGCSDSKQAGGKPPPKSKTACDAAEKKKAAWLREVDDVIAKIDAQGRKPVLLARVDELLSQAQPLDDELYAACSK